MRLEVIEILPEPQKVQEEALSSWFLARFRGGVEPGPQDSGRRRGARQPGARHQPGDGGEDRQAHRVRSRRHPGRHAGGT